MTTRIPELQLTARSLALPLLALVVITALHLTAGSPKETSGPVTVCGPAVTVRDPDIRRSSAQFDRDQSASAREICAVYVASTNATAIR
jgi:hypothetical protein